MQLGLNAKKERMYILGACDLFPETPVLVDFTKFSLFSDPEPATTLSKSANNSSTSIGKKPAMTMASLNRVIP